jgi:xylulose-5-phosphate/fructose-6-phosphate phosphoketolase
MTTLTQASRGPLCSAELENIHAWWRAADYLSVGQIYLLDNPLLREPLRPEHVKPRLLGHFGTTAGLNFIYAHMTRAIGPRAECNLSRWPGTRRRGACGERLSGWHLQRGLSAHPPR